jgi:carbamoyltransferase
MEDYFYDMPDNPYMLYVGRVKKDKLDSITHVDGTCRVQTVSEDSSFKKLLERFRYLTNLPILLNTSLNIAGKPIAGNPNDAIEVFKNSPIDAMVIGNQIMLKNS